jgi:hypothetical protein
LEGLKLDPKFIILGVIVCALAFGYGLMRVKPLREELNEIKNKRIKIDSVSVNDSFDKLTDLNSKYKKKIATLDNLVKNQMYATYPLEAIPAALPKGMWLESFNLSQRKPGVELILNGQVYLESGEKEFESVNVFLTNLKKDPEFSSYFREIAISSIDQKMILDKSVTVFTITCQSSAEKK